MSKEVRPSRLQLPGSGEIHPNSGFGQRDNGEIQVTLDKETATPDLKKGLRAEGARFDRFGLFNSNSGGQLMCIYLDDLKYTAGRARP